MIVVPSPGADVSNRWALLNENSAGELAFFRPAGPKFRNLVKSCTKDPSADGNLISAQGIFTANASRNYVHAPGKFVAVVGVNDVVVVETEDALLVTTRENSQDVSKVVKYLDEKKLKKLV